MNLLPFPLAVVPPAIITKKRPALLQQRFSAQLFSQFMHFPIEKADQALRRLGADYWEQQGQRRALELFQAAARRVPAYKDFLRKQKIRPGRIRTFADFQQVPPVDKHNYLQAYPLESLYWDGQLANASMIAVSSGSSGEPFFWPRADLLEFETTYIQELYLNTFFHINQHSTLYINCFAMGMYIAGPIILNSALRIAQKGYPMVVITPGLSMEDIMRIIPNLGPRFDQIVLAGYPPYVKDIIEEAARRGFDWRKMKTRLVLAGEGFSEQWRDYVAELAGGINVFDSIINLYGTADASIIGHETPLSITVRRFADHDPNLRQELFGSRDSHRLPTLIQYLPTQKYFEVIDDEIHFTTTGGIPLIRYNIHDNGGVLSYTQVMKICHMDDGIQSWHLPFMYLYGRSDFTVVLYGANVYPENIKAGLESKELRKIVTGRFMMSIERRRNHDPYLCIRVELVNDSKSRPSLVLRIQQVLMKYLLEQNDEYRVIFKAKGRKVRPSVTLHQTGDSRYFARQRNKQRWKA